MSRKNRVILVAEDNDDDFFIFQRSLSKAQLTDPTFRATDGQQVIYYLSGVTPYADRTLYPQPSLLLLDLKLPGKHGLDVLRWVKTNPKLKTMPVVILSSSQESSDIHQAYDLGANAFLTKPTSIDSMVEIARSIGAFWLDQNCFDPGSPGSAIL